VTWKEEGGTEIPTLTSLWRTCKNRLISSLWVKKRCGKEKLSGFIVEREMRLYSPLKVSQGNTKRCPPQKTMTCKIYTETQVSGS